MKTPSIRDLNETMSENQRVFDSDEVMLQRHAIRDRKEFRNRVKYSSGKDSVCFIKLAAGGSMPSRESTRLSPVSRRHFESYGLWSVVTSMMPAGAAVPYRTSSTFNLTPPPPPGSGGVRYSTSSDEIRRH
eukprot:767915-Hanusia_phi.AAC.4